MEPIQHTHFLAMFSTFLALLTIFDLLYTFVFRPVITPWRLITDRMYFNGHPVDVADYLPTFNILIFGDHFTTPFWLGVGYRMGMSVDDEDKNEIPCGVAQTISTSTDPQDTAFVIDHDDKIN